MLSLRYARHRLPIIYNDEQFHFFSIWVLVSATCLDLADSKYARYHVVIIQFEQLRMRRTRPCSSIVIHILESNASDRRNIALKYKLLVVIVNYPSWQASRVNVRGWSTIPRPWSHDDDDVQPGAGVAAVAGCSSPQTTKWSNVNAKMHPIHVSLLDRLACYLLGGNKRKRLPS